MKNLSYRLPNGTFFEEKQREEVLFFDEALPITTTTFRRPIKEQLAIRLWEILGIQLSYFRILKSFGKIYLVLFLPWDTQPQRYDPIVPVVNIRHPQLDTILKRYYRLLMLWTPGMSWQQNEHWATQARRGLTQLNAIIFQLEVLTDEEKKCLRHWGALCCVNPAWATHREIVSL